MREMLKAVSCRDQRVRNRSSGGGFELPDIGPDGTKLGKRTA
jgi:hypothetical protein